MRPDPQTRILYPFAGDTIGGSHLSTLEIIRGLDCQIFQPVIILHRADGPLASLLREQGLSFETDSSLAYPLSLGTIIPQIKRACDLLKFHRIDLVHCDDGPLRYVWQYAARLSGCRYIHVQRTIPRLNPEKRLAFAMADAVVTNSLATQRALPWLGGNVRRAMAYPPVTMKYTPADRARNRAVIAQTIGTGNEKLVLFLANLHARKRPDVFIAMAVALQKHGIHNVRYVMVGAPYGDMESILKAQVARHGLQDVFYFAGFQHDPQQWISAADILVVTSENEAFGRTLVEAMRLGTPVIAARGGGHDEIITDHQDGFLVVPGNPAAFAARVMELLQHPELIATITAAAYDSTAARFIKNDSLRVFYDLYQSLTSPKV
jgi:glycosyltransferase involved in cell wall biosynthesis